MGADSQLFVQILTIGHTGAGGCTCTRRVGRAEFDVKPRCHVPGHADSVMSVDYSSDGKRVVSGSCAGFVTIWNAETGAEVPSVSHCYLKLTEVPLLL